MAYEPFEGVTAATRAVMRANKDKGTRPEMAVRRLAHAMGYRYRLHRKDLPGKPDLAFGPRRKIVFVHGCFWHGHIGCRHGHVPAKRLEYWGPKLARNKGRDARHLQDLSDLGWESLIVWECEVRDEVALRERLAAFLGPTPR